MCIVRRLADGLHVVFVFYSGLCINERVCGLATLTQALALA